MRVMVFAKATEDSEKGAAPAAEAFAAGQEAEHFGILGPCAASRARRLPRPRAPGRRYRLAAHCRAL